QKNTFDPFNLNELLQELSRKQKEVLWERLTHLLKETLMGNPVETWQREEDAESNDGMEDERAPEMKQTAAVIQGVTAVVTASIPVVDETVNYKALLECAFILNGIVPALPESENILQDAIQHVCEMWWEKGLEGKEQLGKTVFILLLRKSLSKAATGADIVRLWNLHQTLLCFDYDSEDSNEVKDLLLQCFMSVKLIKKEEKCTKCISCCLICQMLSYFHKQSKVRQGVEEMLYRLYKPILWRALKARNSEVRSNAAFLFIDAFPIRDPSFSTEEMDTEIQKQFEELFSLLEDPHPVVRSTGILGVSQITSKYWEMIPPAVIADLLKKLIEELACDVTSADVRCSVFKCLPITLDNKLSHPLLEQLLPTVIHSLHDNSEKVRVAFVDLLLKIKATKAAKFWKICPMEHLLARLEVDSRPVARRIVNLLFNSFLPINQPEDVWCERCVTLIQMNSAAARKFYQYAYEYTAPTNIAKLMLTIRRCLNACIQKAMKEGFDEDAEDEGEKENLSVLNDVLSINDVASMASLLEITVILWRSIHKALDHNEDAKDYTIRKFASVLPEYFKVFKDDRCTTPLVILASFMPPAAVPTFSCGVISKLRNIDSGADQSKYCTLIDCMCRWGQVGHVMELACDWLSDMPTPRKNVKTSERRVRIHVTHESKPGLALDYIEYLLTHPVNRACLLSAPKKKLNHLLKTLSASKEILGSVLKGTERNSGSCNQATGLRAFSLYCRLTIHLQNKFSEEGKDFLSLLEETGAWVESHVLPFILATDQEDGVSKQSNVPELIIQAYLSVCKDVIMVGLGNLKFQAHFLNTALLVIQTARGGFCTPVLLCALKEITEASLTQSTETDEVGSVLQAVQTVFQKVLECVAIKIKEEQEEGIQVFLLTSLPVCRQILTFTRRQSHVTLEGVDDVPKFFRPSFLHSKLSFLHSVAEKMVLMQSLQTPLGDLIHTVQCWRSLCPAVHQGVLSTLLAAMLAEINYTLQEASSEKDFAIPRTVPDLPPLSSSLMAVIIKSVNVVRSFLNELLECILSEEIEGVFSLTSTVCIVVIIKGQSNQFVLYTSLFLFNIIIFQIGKHKTSLLKDVAAVIERKLITYKEAAAEGSGSTER
ncbi:UNVERIFIED_CONTAM: hypothetical protein H355_013671, partial [Colinus virginianus]